MKLDDFDFFLPEELIAQEPIEKRDMSRLLVLHKETGEIEHRTFRDIVSFLNPGDCLVLNNTRVMPARLYGHREGSGGKIEVLLLKRIDKDKWEVLVKPGKKAKTGVNIIFGNGELSARVLEHTEDGGRIIAFKYEGIFEEVLDKLGEMPLPHYIKKELKDRERYQTVYSKVEGSAASPTAGLHFTKELLEEIGKPEIDFDMKGGFGLKNVNQRIKLYYGQQYGLIVSSEYNRGTSIKVTLPVGGSNTGVNMYLE
jgi:S-adenosylmethionine:tRNA ribosyltransferase-isomerase